MRSLIEASDNRPAPTSMRRSTRRDVGAEPSVWCVACADPAAQGRAGRTTQADRRAERGAGRTTQADRRTEAGVTRTPLRRTAR